MTKSDAMWQSSNSWRRRSPPSSSQEEVEEGSKPYQRSALEMRTEHRRAYSPVAETLFRKDLISAMKLPDNEPLEPDDYWTVQDTWKQEWEKGVQVPVKPDGLPEPQVRLVSPSTTRERFTLPKKLICMNTNGSYTAETHQVTPMVLRAEQVCTYDLDDVDQTWLNTLNGERALMGLGAVTENEMERTMEELESQVWEKISSSLRNSDDLEIAQDDSVICDVCRSPESEETNEMVFCDQCNICVHQACYGIMSIPSGPWVCRTCALGIKPPCELCPNKGGAMKSTRTGQKWAHVSCALWIPEVSIGCVEKMEPITKISSIPPSRWSLVCVLCKERMGSCIQCSVKTCKIAYHVTCAFRHNLEMRAIIEDENAEDGVKLRSYCQKHSLNCKKKMEDSDSESGGRKQNLSPEDRRQRMARIEREFFKLVDLAVVAAKVQLSPEIVDFVYRYWILKRRAANNKPLLPPRGEDESLSGLKTEDTERDKMKMLVGIRQDLERVRNLAYMVSRREKLSRSFLKLREQILEKQLVLLADEEPANQMSLLEMSAVLEANHGPTIYDRTFSNPEAEQPSYEDFEAIVARIAGEITEGTAQIRKDNPFRKKSGESSSAPLDQLKYERIFSDTSQSESDDSFIQNVKPIGSRRTSVGTAASGQQPKKGRPNSKDISNKIKPQPPNNKKSTSAKSSSKAGSSNKLTTPFHTDSSMSSSEEEAALKRLSPRKGGKSSVRNSSSSVAPGAPVSSRLEHIYSDSDSDIVAAAVVPCSSNTAENRSSAGGRGRKKSAGTKAERKKTESSSAEGWRDSEDTQNSLDRPPRSPVFRTKAAMKEFSLEDLHRAKELVKTSSSSRPPAVSPTKEAASSIKTGQTKQDGKRRRALSGDDSEPAGIGAPEEDELGPPIILVPERTAARKANQRLKFPAAADEKSKKGNVSDSIGNDLAGDGARKKSLSDRITPANAGLFGDSDSDDSSLLPLTRSRSPNKTVANSRDVRKSPRGVQHGGTSAYPPFVPPSDSDLSDRESTPVAHKKHASPATGKQAAPATAKPSSKKSSKTVYDKAAGPTAVRNNSLAFTDDDDDEISFLQAAEKAAPHKPATARLNNRNHKAAKSPFVGEVEFDSLLPAEPKARSDSESEAEFRNKKREFDDFENPEMLPFVPQRKAAKKASEQLREQDLWKKTQQEILLASLQQAQLEKAAGVDAKKRGRQNKKKKGAVAGGANSDSDAELFRRRRRSSDSSSSSSSSSASGSVSEMDKACSPRAGRGAKSPKGARRTGVKMQSPRPGKATAVKRQRNSNKKSPRGSRPDGVISSSKALEYLNQRESQISNILESYSREEIDAGKDPPDKKLKTSEGRPDTVQSPPADSKAPTDSESDADSSSDSIIQQIKRTTAKTAASADATSATSGHRDQPETATFAESDTEQAGDNVGDTDLAAVDTSAPKTSPGLRSTGAGAGSCRRADSTSPAAQKVSGGIEVDRDTRKNGATIAERLHQLPGGEPRPASTASEGKQLQQPGTATSGASGSPVKRSIFSPDRTAAETFCGSRHVAAEPEPSGQKTHESPVSWRSPRDGKLAEGRSPRLGSSHWDKTGGSGGRDQLHGPAKSPGQSPALSRSFEGISGGLPRGSPQLTNRSPAVAVAQSPVKSSPHQPPLGRGTVAADPLKSCVEEARTDLMLQALNKSDNEPEELPGSGETSSGRKYSVESKDSDGDSAKSSLMDPGEAILRDFGKEDEVADTASAVVRDVADVANNSSAAGAKSYGGEEESPEALATQQQAQLLLASSGQQAKMDEGYVSAEKVHPADPIGQTLALFENSLIGINSMESSKRAKDTLAVGSMSAQQHQQAASTHSAHGMKSPGAAAVASSTVNALQVLKENAELDFTRHQDYQAGKKLQQQPQQQQQKSAEEELANYFNHAAAAAAASSSSGVAAAAPVATASSAASMSAWSEQLQHLQQQQLQQQLQLMENSRTWPAATSFGGQMDSLKAKPAASVLEHQAEKKAAESMLAAASQQQQQQYQEAIISQMLSYQSKQMTQQQQLAYAQQYMKELGIKGLEAQNFELYNQLNYQYMMAQNMATYGLNKKAQEDLILSAWQAEAGWYGNPAVVAKQQQQQQQLGHHQDKISVADMDKIARSELEKMTREQQQHHQQFSKGGRQHQQQPQQQLQQSLGHHAHHLHQQHHKSQQLESRPSAEQRSYLDQLRSHETKSFQEQLRTQERRAQSDSSGRGQLQQQQQSDMDRFQMPGSSSNRPGYHHQQHHHPEGSKVEQAPRSHLDVLAQFSQQLAGKSESVYGRSLATSVSPPPDKSKSGHITGRQQPLDHHFLPPSDARSAAASHRGSLQEGDTASKKTISTDAIKLGGGDLRSQYEMLSAYAATENLRMQAAAQHHQGEPQQQHHLQYHQGAYHQQQQPQHGISRDPMAAYSGVARDNSSHVDHQQQQQQSQMDLTNFSCQKQQQQQQSLYANNKNSKDMSVDPFRRIVSPVQPVRTKPTSPRHDNSYSSSCRVEQQKQQQEQELLLQQQQQVYGVPSATPVDKLPGFMPSVSHGRDQKRQSHEGTALMPPAVGHHEHGADQRKGRDTPASVAGSDGSHNSAPTSGIPNELLDSVLETAKLPVWRPPDSSAGATPGVSGARPDIKVASPAKPPHASPKAIPVMSSSSERDNTSALEELVKHIDASPSPRDSTRTVSSNPGSTPSHQPSGGSTAAVSKKDTVDSDKQHQQPSLSPRHSPKESPGQLVYSNIPELMGTGGATVAATTLSSASGGHHSDRDLSEAERSDYDNEQHDKGGVDYDDEEEDEDEDDLPLGSRRRGNALALAATAALAKPRAQADISKWAQTVATPVGKAATTTTTKELKIKIGRPPLPLSPPSRTAGDDVAAAPAAKPEILTKRGTRVPCYREEPEEDVLDRRAVAAKLPGQKDTQSSSAASGTAAAAVKSKMKGGGRSAGASRLFGGKSGPKYDKKAFELVNQKLAGTDFDLEASFGEFGVEKEDGLASLRDFRVASKNKRNESFGSEGGDGDLSTSNTSQIPPLQYDFEDSGDEVKQLPVPLAIATPTRGKGRTTKAKKPPEKRPVQPKVIPLKIKSSALPAEEEDALMKKVPTLKIKIGGALEPSLLRQVRKEPRADRAEPSAEVEEEEKFKPSLKLTIKVPKKSLISSERPENGSLPASLPILPPDNPIYDPDASTGSVLAMQPVEELSEPPTLIVRPGHVISPPIRTKAPQKKSADVDSMDNILLPIEKAKSDIVRSSPARDVSVKKSAVEVVTLGGEKTAASVLSDPHGLAVPTGGLDPSPRKPKGGPSIDSLASKLLAKQQSSSDLSLSQASELVAIFGPEEPLSVNIIDNPSSIAAVTDRLDDGPSELDLLTMELKKLEREQQQKDESAAAAAKLAETDDTLSADAVIPETAAVERADPAELRHPNQYDEGAHSKIHHHQIKYKFKPSQIHQQPTVGEPDRSSSPLTGQGQVQPPVKINLMAHGSSSSSAATSVDIHMRRMRKKELLNSYLGIEAPVPPLAAVLTNGPVSGMGAHYHHHQNESMTREPVRMNIIKMPKAVASVTSVPTRADYQSQLEANLERKRKREGKEDLGKNKGQKKGKGKQGRNKDDAEEAYKPKLKKNTDDSDEVESKGELRIRTRGKPPKKCLLEESPERDGPLDSFKKTNLRFAEEIRKQFDLENDDDKTDNVGLDGGGSFAAKEERRRKEKRRRLDDDLSKEEFQPKGKSPRIVIKISKNKDSKVIGKDNNGLTQPVASNNDINKSLKIQPLKIKL